MESEPTLSAIERESAFFTDGTSVKIYGVTDTLAGTPPFVKWELEHPSCGLADSPKRVTVPRGMSLANFLAVLKYLQDRNT